MLQILLTPTTYFLPHLSSMDSNFCILARILPISVFLMKWDWKIFRIRVFEDTTYSLHIMPVAPAVCIAINDNIMFLLNLVLGMDDVFITIFR